MAGDVDEVGDEVVVVDPAVVEAVAAEFVGRYVAGGDGHRSGEVAGKDRADVAGGAAEFGHQPPGQRLHAGQHQQERLEQQCHRQGGQQQDCRDAAAGVGERSTGRADREFPSPAVDVERQSGRRGRGADPIGRRGSCREIGDRDRMVTVGGVHEGDVDAVPGGPPERLGEQVAETVHADGEPAKSGAAGRLTAGIVSAFVGRQECEHALLGAGLLDEIDRVCCGRAAGIAGRVDGCGPGRVGVDVEAQGVAVLRQRLDIGHDDVFGPGRHRHRFSGGVTLGHGEVLQPGLRALTCHERGQIGLRDDGIPGQRLKIREPIQQIVGVGLELRGADVLGRVDEPAEAFEYLLMQGDAAAEVGCGLVAQLGDPVADPGPLAGEVLDHGGHQDSEDHQ